MSQLDIDSFEHLLSVLSSYAVSPSQPAAENSVSRSRVRPIYTHELHARGGGNNNDRIDREDREKHWSVVGVVG